MDERLNSLKGQKLPSLACDFREYAYASVWRKLRRRRWARRGRAALVFAVCVSFVWATTILLPNVVVKRFLEKLPLEELVAIHDELVPKWPISRACEGTPWSQVIERSDVLVHAKVVDVTPNVGDIINDIVESQDVINRILNREEVILEDDIRVNLQLQVFKTHPPIDVKELVAIRRDTIGGVYYIKAGHEGIFALRRARKGIFGLPRLRKGTPLYNIAVEHGGIYLIDQKRSVVSGIRGAAKALPLDEAWEFVCDLYDTTHGAKRDESNILNK